jgi:CRISPR-associated protein Csb3
MSELVLASSEPQVMLSHMTLYGLGSILEAQGMDDLGVSWTGGPNPRPQISAPRLDIDRVGTLVLSHARACAAGESWMLKDIPGTKLGLMSPRLTPFADDKAWQDAQAARHGVLDSLTDSRSWLDLRFLAALGEPSYWSIDRKGDRRPDDGASRLEMQPRNRGSEFVGSRLRKVAAAVASREVAGVVSGLCGESVRDEGEKDKSDSRTATGFANLGPTDSALAWCALWGIAQFPIAMRVVGRDNTPASTTGHLPGKRRQEWFYVPMWRGVWRPARLRSVLAGRALRRVAAAGLELRAGSVTDADVAVARARLSASGVVGVIRFPIERFGSDSAPERRSMRGEPLSLRES